MIRCEGIRFAYPGDSFALEIENFEVADGDAVALVGPSGCGKTTLLNLLAGILLPEKGTILIGSTAIANLPHRSRQAFRLSRIGLVPQNFELLDYLTVGENILAPLRLAESGIVTPDQEERARELTERAGILSFWDKIPSQLSQGERQRVALCRGLISSPDLILADEPTGNLDPENQDRIVSLLLDEASRIGATVVMITHEPELKQRFDKVFDVLESREGGSA
jgi:putative ABC transport system ATP-binding protein